MSNREDVYAFRICPVNNSIVPIDYLTEISPCWVFWHVTTTGRELFKLLHKDENFLYPSLSGGHIVTRDIFCNLRDTFYCQRRPDQLHLRSRSNTWLFASLWPRPFPSLS